ncbi:hypothetical protein D3C71_1785330 [compost metagenome]
MLFNFVIDGVLNGTKITELLAAFANTYGISISSVTNSWARLAKETEMYVEAAKSSWRRIREVERENEKILMKDKTRQEKQAMRFENKVRRLTERSLAKWERKRAKQVEKSIPTTQVAHPAQSRLYVRIDASGVVSHVEDMA